MLKTTALLNPNSATLNTDKIELNRLFKPKYSAPRLYINAVLTKKGKSRTIILFINPITIFLAAFFVRLIFTFYTP